MKITKTKSTMKRLSTFVASAALVFGAVVSVYGSAAFAAKPTNTTTQVPGHAKSSDADNNGSPDAGVWVNGHYTALYTYDGDGKYVMDYGDGRPLQMSIGVTSLADLDQSTLTTCDYVVNYRADYNNDPYMDQGSIHNNLKCSGYEKATQYINYHDFKAYNSQITPGIPRSNLI